MFSGLHTGSLQRDSASEWVISNGLGGWASSTAAGVNTRRYHGFLVAATAPPGGRMLLVSKVEDSAVVGGVEHHLSSNYYPGVVHPGGYNNLSAFDLDPFPVYTYRVGGAVVSREVVPEHGRNAVLIIYRVVDSDTPVTILAAPLINRRDYHGITHRPQWDFAQRIISPGGPAASDLVEVSPPWEAPPMLMRMSGPYGSRPWYRPGGDWYRDMEYPRELERGLEFREDQYRPGCFGVTLSEGETGGLWIEYAEAGGSAARPCHGADAGNAAGAVSPVIFRDEQARGFAARAGFPQLGRETDAANEVHFERMLRETASSFIVSAGSGEGATIIAGYPWFEEWGRDAFISLPGLCLVTGKYAEARGVFKRFTRRMRDGLVPNRIGAPGDAAEGDYGSVDASLWMIYSLWKYLQYTGDSDFVRRMMGAVVSIIDHYAAGTRYGIHACDNGLLWQGEGCAQLTWMDARVDGIPVTARQGWAVEINGLWYNSLRSAADIARQTSCHLERAGEFDEMARNCQKSFDLLMRDGTGGMVFDVRGPDGADRRLRPNQVICMFLPFPLIDGETGAAALDLMMNRLLTPFGLRTLDPEDPAYAGHYCGGVKERDAAYHQGTVWPWLTGPLVTAVRRADGYTPRSRAAAWDLIKPYASYMSREGAGTIPELFDGNPPHSPGGCVSQAWRVAEVFRAYVEEYLEAGPSIPTGGR